MNTNLVYVGMSINLYSRICSYFMLSILGRADRKVLRYFKENGFNNVKLTLLILDSDSTWEQAIELEQFYIDLLSLQCRPTQSFTRKIKGNRYSGNLS